MRNLIPALVNCLLPMAFLWAAVGIAWQMGDGILAASRFVIWLSIALLGVSLISIFRSHFNASVSDRIVWLSISLSGLALIMLFAQLHQAAGLICAAPICVQSESDYTTFETSLYFSIVTFTTLGYGDFQPQPDMRLLAATQAILGYIYLGLVVGLLIDTGARRD